MKIIVTTSNAYHHCVEIFIKLFNREWGNSFELVGYEKPAFKLPYNCSWVSLGEQRGPKFFSDDLRPYFEKQDQYFIWLFEDSFIRSVNHQQLRWLINQCETVWCKSNIGRICLSREGMNREHVVNGKWWFADPNSRYRLSTQPSIWNRDFLLQYLKPGLDPWFFEKQETVDGWTIMGPIENIVTHNEGTTKHNIHKLNLEGIEL